MYLMITKFFAMSHNSVKNLRVIFDGTLSLEQGSATYGPRAGSGPRSDIIRPAKRNRPA